MPLTAEQRQRYARHLLLPELGEHGQEALCAATARLRGDAAAVEAAADYLARAGVTITAEAADAEVDVGSPAQLTQLAGDPALRHAAAALRGAHAAVEAIKAITGAGQAGTFPAELRLTEDVEGP